MTPSDVKQLIGAMGLIASNTADKVCVGTKELTLSNTAQSLSFATLLNGTASSDVKYVSIKVKSAGSPTDSTHLVRYTEASGDTPTVTHGMWFGEGDFFDITGNGNVVNSKFIAAELGVFSVLTISYYA